VVDRAQEQRRIWIRDVRETRRLIGLRELPHSLGDSLDRLRMHPRPQRRRVAGYHQTTESMPSSSSTGFVYTPDDRYFQPSSGAMKTTFP
jgi:hypothetical protein